MRAFNPARPGREQRLGEASGDAVGSGFTHGGMDGPASAPATTTNLNLQMSYVVFARKWRPRTLTDVVGQETVTRTLRNALTSGRIGHAFLLTGARGVGKTSTARILAAALNCSAGEGPTPDPCGRCPACTEIAAGNSIDVQEIDAASNNGVDDVRELRESTRFNPSRDRYRIWIIDEVHMLSTPAFNALLKTLEEPPPRVKFILATTELKKLPETVLSRCQIHAFRLVPARTLATHLRSIAKSEKIEVSDSALLRIARAAEGSVRDALSLFDQVYAFTGAQIQDEDVARLLGLIDRELLREATRAVFDNDSAAVLRVIETLASYGADYELFSHELLLYWRDLLILKISPDSDSVDLLPEDRAAAAQAVTAIAEEDLLRLVDSLSRSELDFRKSIDPDPRLSLEMALLKAAQLRRLVGFAELVSRVEQFLGDSPRPTRRTLRGRRQTATARRRSDHAAPDAEPRSAHGRAAGPSRRTRPGEDRTRRHEPGPRRVDPRHRPPAQRHGGPDAALGSRIGQRDRRQRSPPSQRCSGPEELPRVRTRGPRGQRREGVRSQAEGRHRRGRRRSRRHGARQTAHATAPVAVAARDHRARAINPAPSSSAKAPSKSALKSKAMADPVVGRTLDLFGGTLLDVKPLAGAIETLDDGEEERE